MPRTETFLKQFKTHLFKFLEQAGVILGNGVRIKKWVRILQTIYCCVNTRSFKNSLVLGLTKKISTQKLANCDFYILRAKLKVKILLAPIRLVVQSNTSDVL
jgi:hypothetical protein